MPAWMKNRTNKKRWALSAIACAVLALPLMGCQWMGESASPGDPDKVCVAHRGASAYRPEHTLAAYTLALEMGADYVEQDLQMTKDGVLVCLHDTSLERTTDVEEVFPDRFDKETADKTGRKTWLVAEFTLDELKRLSAGSWFGPEFENEKIPTFQEALDLVMGNAGIYPELKEPGYYAQFGMNMVDAVISELAANGLNTPEGQEATPVFIQSFSPEALKEMKSKTGETYRLIQLISVPQGKQLLADEALPEVASYSYGIGPSVTLLRADPTRVHRAHAHGLKLHPYTVSESNLPPDYPDLKSYTDYLLNDLGVDGVFTNNPDLFPRP